MMIKLSRVSSGPAGEEDVEFWVQSDLISTFQEEEFYTLIFIPPYLKPVKIREDAKTLKELINKNAT